MTNKCNKLKQAFLTQSTINNSIQGYYENIYESELVNKFDMAPNVYTIKMEEPYASNNYVDYVARLSSVTTKVYGFTFSDDYKTISYGSIYDYYPIGTKYFFDNNYWLIYNPDMIRSLAGSAIIRRCNNVMRWVDRSTGLIVEEPCILENTIWGNTDSNDLYLTKPKGYVKVYVQRNENTMKIEPNYRFMFGNKNFWNVYKIPGGGVDNIINNTTYDNTGPSLINFTMLVDYVDNARDDIENGIADIVGYGKVEPEQTKEIRISPNVDKIQEGESVIFTLNKYVNEEIVEANFEITKTTVVPNKYYTFNIIDNNKFEITNLAMYMKDPIIVTVSDGDSSSDFMIWLAGW